MRRIAPPLALLLAFAGCAGPRPAGRDRDPDAVPARRGGLLPGFSRSGVPDSTMLRGQADPTYRDSPGSS